MALKVGVNAYSKVTAADAYFEDRIDVADWDAADETKKGKALVTATRLFQDLDWAGFAISDTQVLAFPRNITYYEPRLGIEITITETPSRILEGIYELAHHLLLNEGVLDDSGTVTDLQVDVIRLDIRTDPNTIPPLVKKMIRPLLANSGARTWWRAN